MNLSYFLSKAQRLLKILLQEFFLVHPLRSSFFLKRLQMAHLLSCQHLQFSVMLQSYLDAVSTVKEANISTWDDIERIDIRPDKGIAKIKSKNNWEIQIDIETSEIYASNYRRSDIIESIHDGSFFSEIVKYGWFLPSGILLLTLSLTGIYMFFIPILKKRKRNK